MIDFLRRAATASTSRIFALPVLVLMPHSRCNCRCIMCDIWKANQEKKEITIEELQRHLDAFRKLGVKRVALSGGEALMHSNLWKFSGLLRSTGAKISLLSTGVTLAAHAREVVEHCDDVIVSLDGSREVHNRIRNIPLAFEKLEQGVRAIKNISPAFRVTGRTVLQKQNFRDFPAVIHTAKMIGLDQISFLGADVSSEAFNRPDPWAIEKVSEISLTEGEVQEFEALLERSFDELALDYQTRFIAERPAKMMEIVQHYRAINKTSLFPEKRCNAPWVSVVVESNGDVLPCFFHPAYGNIHDKSFKDIINSNAAVTFRRNLKVNEHPTCIQCVCSLHLGITKSV